MGLLDDAIREHLELKRRRGGDPAEIERAEREALGPVRRHPESAEPAPYAEPEASYEPLVDEPLVGEPAEAPPPLSGREFVDPLLEPDPAAPAPHRAGDPVASEDPAEYPPHEPEDHLSQATVEYHVAYEGEEPEHEALSHEPAQHEPPPRRDRDPEARNPEDARPEPPGREPLAHEEDVHGEDAHGEELLEETPEFLQDAPEHDRLWFEQRPPRDFDFDG